ncbi:hypothetical protein BJV78DRAFT_1257588 [Lactifluus subvellereus]|nr:hypothetical protein BJV78DRAFT_1257588 [Lactifluus subvellereus]
MCSPPRVCCACCTSHQRLSTLLPLVPLPILRTTQMISLTTLPPCMTFKFQPSPLT